MGTILSPMSDTSDPGSASTAPSDPAPPVERTAAEEWLGTKPQKPGLAHRIGAVWKDEYDTAMNWPRGKRHLVMRGLAVFIVNTIALLIVAELMGSINFTGEWLGYIGTAALAFLIGAGGLGDLIFTGISLMQPDRLLAGAIPVTLMALMADFLCDLGEVLLIPRGLRLAPR